MLVRRVGPVVAVVLTVLVVRSTVGVYAIPSGSMETTLHGCEGCENDRVLVDKVTPHLVPLRPGDVVVFHGPDSWLAAPAASASGPGAVLEGLGALVGTGPPGSEDFVKRVIATGGQTVQCCDARGRVLVDGVPLQEPYVHIDPRTGPGERFPFGPVTVPEGHLWVMGDNRNNSADARFRGPVAVEDVVGRARFVVWPPARWSAVPAPDPRQG